MTKLNPLFLRFLVMIVFSLTLFACKGKEKTELIVDADPILAPSRTPPIEEILASFSPDWIPASAPLGLVYDSDVEPQDLSESSYERSIRQLLKKRLIPIDDEGWFHPKQPLTRGEALLWFYNIYDGYHQKSQILEDTANTSGEGVPSVSEERIVGSSDESSETSSGRPYFQALAQKLKLTGVMDGYGDFLLNSDWPIKREELATLAWLFTHPDHNLSEKSNITPEEMTTFLKKTYSDSAQDISPGCLQGIYFLTQQRRGDLYRQLFLNPSPSEAKNGLEPQKLVTREQAAQLIYLLEPTFQERVFINRKQQHSVPQNPAEQSPPSDYSNSYGEQTAEEKAPGSSSPSQ